VVGKGFESGQALHDALALVEGNRYAKAALDTAWWDLQARLREKPLHELLQGRQDVVALGVSFGRMDSIDALLEAMTEARDAGYSRMEVKFLPGWDLHMLNAVRQTFPTETIHADCEGGLTLENMEVLYRMEDFTLALIEQPLPAYDLVGHAMVQEALRTPVALDRSISRLEQADIALELHSCHYVNIDPGRVGGLTPAAAIHDLCHDRCTPCWVGAAPQSAVGMRIGLALASKQNFTYPADFYPEGSLLRQDLAPLPETELLEADGDNPRRRVARMWSEPGLGIEPDAEALDRATVSHVRIEG
jgi:O-succinylbenzoate synthase